jgi:hypothetical protein
VALVILPLLVLTIGAAALLSRDAEVPAEGRDLGEVRVPEAAGLAREPGTRPTTLGDVLDLAQEALAKMEGSLDDYTARFVKQERDQSGVLGERSVMELKVQTRLRNEANDAPMRIYLRFIEPPSTAGREVIWGADLYEGQMAVHETSLVLGWKTLWLDPNGMLAMNGQRFPIYEIGLTRLVEKLLERGARDLNNPDIGVTLTPDHPFDGRSCDLIQVVRNRPSGGEDDFSLAEIIYDPEQMLILSYRSFGWPDPEKPDAKAPLLESYEYLDLKVNAGLTEQDFDIKNPAYGFP